MVKECMDYMQRCQAYQFHANLIHQLPELLHPTIASWPFDAWGLVWFGHMTKSFSGHLYILAATDYFSMWVEAIPLKEVKKKNLKALDEKRLEVQQRLECYQARLSRAFNKKVRSRSFQVGNLVLAMRRPIITTHRIGNKFTSKWDGPYVVKEVYTNGAYKLVAENGLRIGPLMENS
ncbi:hypothetical protein Pfo_011589 [Paulownia fortunei]|nr:hypothetical protein Pfo_011589 [Paulownia fortunei]